MNNSWMRAGQTGSAHWVKLAGSRFFTTACQTILSRETAQSVPTQKVALAGAPGRDFVRHEVNDTNVCQVCLSRARQQA